MDIDISFETRSVFGVYGKEERKIRHDGARVSAMGMSVHPILALLAQ
jgi:hypothetical protein